MNFQFFFFFPEEKWVLQALVFFIRFLILTVEIKPVSSRSECITLTLSISNMLFQKMLYFQRTFQEKVSAKKM